MRRLALLALVLVTGCVPVTLPAPAMSPSPSVTVTDTSTASLRIGTPLVPEPPTAGIAARGGIVVPANARLIAITDALSAMTRAWLVDLSGGADPINVAAWRGPRAGIASETISASADMRIAVVGAWGPAGHAALYAYDVPAGRTTLLYEDPATDVPSYLSPAITPDGIKVAFQTNEDVRVMSTAGGAAQRLVAHPEPNNVYGTWHPIAWSARGTLLAVQRSSEGQSELAIVPAAGGAARVLGAGTSADWRADEPQLVVTGGVGPFGGRNLMYTYDVIAGVKRDLDVTAWPLGSSIGAPHWDPSSDRFAITISQNYARPRDVWTRTPTGPATKEPAPGRDLLHTWWSRTGSVLYALVAREDAIKELGTANLEVIVLSSGRRIATFCRGDTRGGPCP